MPPKIFIFLKNKFSKYVIKKAISCMNTNNKNTIINAYRQKWDTYSINVQNKLNIIIEKMYIKRSTNNLE